MANFATTARDGFIATSSRQSSSTPPIQSELDPKSTVSPLVALARGPCQEMRTRLAPAVPPGGERRVKRDEPLRPALPDPPPSASARGLGQLQLDTPQAQRVGDHRDRAEAHRRARNHWAQQEPDERVEHARRDRDAQDVVDKRPDQVLADVA